MWLFLSPLFHYGIRVQSFQLKNVCSLWTVSYWMWATLCRFCFFYEMHESCNIIAFSPALFSTTLNPLLRFLSHPLHLLRQGLTPIFPFQQYQRQAFLSSCHGPCGIVNRKIHAKSHTHPHFQWIKLFSFTFCVWYIATENVFSCLLYAASNVRSSSK